MTTAREKYGLRIIPAGRDDRIAEITDAGGKVIKLIFCPHSLAGPLEAARDKVIKHDWETMEAGEFASKYIKR
ncbi:MAG: hypothetical protein M1309_05505 [Actinobacteria bacterium]|nr:hypothetical protein [Actinomycetota bacterium]